MSSEMQRKLDKLTKECEKLKKEKQETIIKLRGMKGEISKILIKSKKLYGVYYEDDGCEQQQIFGFDIESLIRKVRDVPMTESSKLEGLQLHWREEENSFVCSCGVKDCKLEDDEEKHFERYTVVKSDTLDERNQKVMNLYKDKLHDIDYFAITKTDGEHEIAEMFGDLFAGLKKFI